MKCQAIDVRCCGTFSLCYIVGSHGNNILIDHIQSGIFKICFNIFTVYNPFHHWSPTLQSRSSGASTIIARGVTLNIFHIVCTRFALTCVLGAKVGIMNIFICIYIYVYTLLYLYKCSYIHRNVFINKYLCVYIYKSSNIFIYIHVVTVRQLSKNILKLDQTDVPKQIQQHGAACNKLFWSAPKPLICK